MPQAVISIVCLVVLLPASNFELVLGILNALGHYLERSEDTNTRLSTTFAFMPRSMSGPEDRQTVAGPASNESQRGVLC